MSDENIEGEAPSVRRIGLVTPYAWPASHQTNDEALELATGITQVLSEQSGTPAIIITPSLHARSLRLTRRALRDLARGADPDEVFSRPELVTVGSDGATPVCVLAVGLPVTLGRASVAVRAALRTIFEHANIDVLHVFDPHEPLSRHALKLWPGLATATHLDTTARATHKRAIESIDMEVELPPIASSHTARGERTTIVIGRGDQDDADVPAAVRQLIPLLTEHPELSVTLLSRWTAHHRPAAPRKLRGRARALRALNRAGADLVLSGAAAYIAVPGTRLRARLEAEAAGVPVVEFGPTLVEDVEAALTRPAPDSSFPSEREIATIYLNSAESLLEKRHSVHIPRLPATRSCMIDLHMHTDHSWDCATDPEALLWTAREVGLTAIAVTDHNEVSGAFACLELAEEYGIQVIVGEEIMTDEGEVIGLFLKEKIEKMLSWDETLERIREQDGLVYVPHPFDRLHTIPEPATLRRTVDQIDLLETFNGRLAFEQYNRDAARFARKYNLAEGAGSDAHVTQSLGTAAVHMPAWDDPESFLAALRQGEIVRRPKSYAYLQSLNPANPRKEIQLQQPLN